MMYYKKKPRQQMELLAEKVEVKKMISENFSNGSETIITLQYRGHLERPSAYAQAILNAVQKKQDDLECRFLKRPCCFDTRP